jgi:glycosyltransferase involved in cell wall biosynthesis
MIEASSMSLPIGGPNDGGSSEIIQDGYNGLLYEPDCADCLSEAMIKILINDRLRRQMAQAALVKSQEFTIERQVRIVEELYHQLLYG